MSWNEPTTWLLTAGKGCLPGLPSAIAIWRLLALALRPVYPQTLTFLTKRWTRGLDWERYISIHPLLLKPWTRPVLCPLPGPRVFQGHLTSSYGWPMSVFLLAASQEHDLKGMAFNLPSAGPVLYRPFQQHMNYFPTQLLSKSVCH